ncbi:hypothetical protein R1flu_024942 [Riccia fluitans]|uniref:Peroxidase n=1 Tax=Riccia fluitans TaxID=41844 RepID=A0ABD1XWC1_9MARC
MGRARERGSAGRMGLVHLSILWLVSWQFQELMVGVAAQALQTGYYDVTCPSAKLFIKNTVEQAFLLDNSIAAAIIRLLFHDCFAGGCDASILLDGPNSEKQAIPNLTVRGYEVIDNAKVQIESLCPGIVSCSDTLVLAAAYSAELLGGPAYNPALGRLDSLTPGIVNLPAPSDGVAATTAMFIANGLDQTDMVILLGAHSVGQSQCQFFSNRLYNFNNSGGPDPSLNSTYLATLQNLCPNNGTGTTAVPLDVQSEFILDSKYYSTILEGKGVLTIDADMAANPGTRNVVSNLAGISTDLNITFPTVFVSSMDKLSRLGLRGLLDGEVRKICSTVN